MKARVEVRLDYSSFALYLLAMYNTVHRALINRLIAMVSTKASEDKHQTRQEGRPTWKLCLLFEHNRRLAE